jgi:hypothetical protein
MRIPFTVRHLCAPAFAALALAACSDPAAVPRQTEPLPQPSHTPADVPSVASNLASAATSERDVIVNNTHLAPWAYHTTNAATVTGERWYISQLQRSSPSGVYSLGLLVGGRAGWWTIGDRAATFNANLALISFASNLDNDPSDTFWDAGLIRYVTNSDIHDDRRGIQGKRDVPVKWYFFEAPNGFWYIIASPAYSSVPNVQKFATKNGQYDWQTIDVSGYAAVFSPAANGSGMAISFRPNDPSDPCASQVVATMIQEYSTFNISLKPGCSSFANSGDSPNFKWRELNGGFNDGSLHEPWGMVRPEMRAGLEATRANYALVRSQPGIRLSSGYRCPEGNKAVGGTSTSFHPHGTAADMYSFSYPWNENEFVVLRNAAWITGNTSQLFDWDTYKDDHHLHVAFKTTSALAINADNAGAQVNQSELARQLLRGSADEQRMSFEIARAMGAQRVAPELRAALATALEREGSLRARRRHGEIDFLENPELIAGLAQLVAEFRDPRSIPALAGAFGTSPPAVYALADFGEPAAESVLGMIMSTDDASVVMDALIGLRFMAEGVRERPLTAGTLRSMRRVAERRMTGTQSVTTLWRAIDLAVALNDPDLMRIVQSIASDRNAVISRGISDPELIAYTQRLAADRLAGVLPLPRR